MAKNDSKNSSITIIGAGAYGTALAIAIARNNHKVILWGYNSAHIKILKETRCNQAYLPGISFPPTLHLNDSLAKVISANKDILIVVPSNVFGNILQKIKPYLRKDTRIVWATKGLENKTGLLLQEVAQKILGNKIPLAVISGPTFAREIAEGLPTAMVMAATNITFSNDLQKILKCDNSLRVYNNSDFIGIQIGGVVKNIIAIGVGISDGIGFGANARAALITKGLAEMSRLGVAMGGKNSTFIGIAGLGDLILTCTDNQSRNRRFGIMIGKGFNSEDAQKNIGKVIEGYLNIKEVLSLAMRFNVEMPITEQIYKIIYQNKNVYQATLSLLNKTQKDEILF